MPATDFEIRIAVASQQAQTALQGLARTLAEINGTTQKQTQLLEQGQRAGESFFGSLRAGIGIDLGGRLVSALAQIPGILLQAGKDGVTFNATLEKSKLAVASLLATFQPEQFKTVGSALGAAADAVERLRVRAAESPATFEQLLGGFQALAGPAFAAGIGVDKQIELTLLLSQSLSSLGLAAEQLPQEARALLTGNIGPDAQLARTLGITNDQVNRAKAAGTLFEFLSQRLASFKEAGDLAAGSFNVQVSNLGDNLQQLKAKATEDVFETLRKQLGNLNRYLVSPEAKAGAEALKNFLGDAAASGKTALTVAGAGARTAFPVASSIAALVGANYLPEARDKVARDREDAEIARLRQALLEARTPQQFDTARNAASIAPFVSGSKDDPLPALSDAAKAKLQLILRDFQTLADVEKRRAEIAAETAARREEELQTATKLATQGNTQEERAKGLRDLLKLQQIELSRTADVDNARLATITRTINAVQGVNAGLTTQRGLFRELQGSAEQVAEQIGRVPVFLRELQDKGKEATTRLAETVLGGNQAGQLKLLDQQLKELREARAALIQQTIPGFSDLPSGGGSGQGSGSLFAGPPLRAPKFGRTPPSNEPSLNIPELDITSDGPGGDALVQGRADAAVRKALERILRENAASLRRDPDLFKNIVDEPTKTALQKILDLQDKIEEGERRRVGTGRAVVKQREEEVSLSRQLAIKDAEAAQQGETLVRLKREEEEAIIRRRELERGASVEAAEATAKEEASRNARNAARIFEREFAFTQLENARAIIAANKEAVENDPTLTAAARAAKLRALQADEIKILRELIKKWEEYNAAKKDSTAPDEREKVGANNRAIASARADINKLQSQGAQPDRTTPLGAIQGGTVDFLRGLGSEAQLAAEAVTGPLNAAFSALQGGLSGLIAGTQSWGQVFSNVGLQIATALASVVLKLIIIQAIVFALNLIGSLFGNPALGTQLLALASKLPGGKREGGPVGYAGGGSVGAALPFLSGPPNSQDTVPAWLMPGEFVVRTSAARRYGPLLEAINNFELPITMPAAFARGGGVSASRAGGGFRGRGEGTILVDNRNVADQLQQNPRYSRWRVREVSSAETKEALGLL